MSQTDITVILTVYNQRPESIETSMRSVAAQTGCTYQLLVADDHSSESFEDEATALASELGISNFTYVFLIAFIFRKSRDKSFGFHDDCFAS